jgi:hypothetical protein
MYRVASTLTESIFRDDPIAPFDIPAPPAPTPTAGDGASKTSNPPQN